MYNGEAAPTSPKSPSQKMCDSRQGESRTFSSSWDTYRTEPITHGERKPKNLDGGMQALHFGKKHRGM